MADENNRNAKRLIEMPKLKTKSGAKKRFKVTGSGKIKRAKAYKRHILTKKETKQKRRLGNKTTVKKVDEGNIKPMLPYLV
jgi:large subunit ribosomal protein L35